MSARKPAATRGSSNIAACELCHGSHAAVYCAADDAFLCIRCDLHVHSANPLAARHLRRPCSTRRAVRLVARVRAGRRWRAGGGGHLPLGGASFRLGVRARDTWRALGRVEEGVTTTKALQTASGRGRVSLVNRNHKLVFRLTLVFLRPR